MQHEENFFQTKGGSWAEPKAKPIENGCKCAPTNSDEKRVERRKAFSRLASTDKCFLYVLFQPNDGRFARRDFKSSFAHHGFFFFRCLPRRVLNISISFKAIKFFMEDSQLIDGLSAAGGQRGSFEKALYLQYNYFIEEGRRKYNLDRDDSFSAYSDAVLVVIHNIANKSFGNQSSLKTYLFQIFSNKCIDLIRKKTTNKHAVHQSVTEPELLSHLPDAARGIVERLIEGQKMQAIKQQLELIGEKCKRILLLYEDGYSDAEIAQQLDYNGAAVAKTTRLRCLEKIKEKMKNIFSTHE